MFNFLTKKSDFRSVLKFHAENNGLNPDIVASLIMRESGGNRWAVRHEPAFYRRYIEGKAAAELPGFFPSRIPTFETEAQLRAYSFGLMQIMGNTARVFGFEKTFLTELFDIDINLKFGCAILGKYTKSRGGLEAGLLAYNGGGDHDYANKVLKIFHSGEFKSLYSLVK